MTEYLKEKLKLCPWYIHFPWGRSVFGTCARRQNWLGHIFTVSVLSLVSWRPLKHVFLILPRGRLSHHLKPTAPFNWQSCCKHIGAGTTGRMVFSTNKNHLPLLRIATRGRGRKAAVVSEICCENQEVYISMEAKRATDVGKSKMKAVCLVEFI